MLLNHSTYPFIFMGYILNVVFRILIFIHHGMVLGLLDKLMCVNTRNKIISMENCKVNHHKMRLAVCVNGVANRTNDSNKLSMVVHCSHVCFLLYSIYSSDFVFNSS